MKRLMTENRLVLDEFGASDQVFDWMGDRQAEGLTCLTASGIDLFVSV
jgi:hypothetical protein